jgi:hypothetical protein
MLGASHQTPGNIAWGHQQVLPNGLAGFERTEPVDGISQALGLLPSRALSSWETLEDTSGAGGCREAFHGVEDFSCRRRSARVCRASSSLRSRSS